MPGLGFYFDNLGALKNVDGGCDLENIDPIGTADVNVTARYPYQPVTAVDPAAAPVHFIVHSLFHKTLAAYAKGPGAENANVRVILAHAQDIDGSPLANEVVCWSQQGAGYIHLFPTSSAGGTILDHNGSDGRDHRRQPGQAGVLHRSLQRSAVHDDGRQRQHGHRGR